MDPENNVSEAADALVVDQPEAPRLSQWLWHPWYAKLWWKAAALFWIAFILEEAFVPRSLFQPLFQEYEGWILAVTFLFHPFLILPVLGFGWLYAMFNQPGGVDHDDYSEDLYGGSSIGFHRPHSLSFLSDPTDIRSPLNPLNPINRMHHPRR
jgi:hypothetical protein